MRQNLQSQPTPKVRRGQQQIGGPHSLTFHACRSNTFQLATESREESNECLFGCTYEDPDAALGSEAITAQEAKWGQGYSFWRNLRYLARQRVYNSDTTKLRY